MTEDEKELKRLIDTGIFRAMTLADGWTNPKWVKLIGTNYIYFYVNEKLHLKSRWYDLGKTDFYLSYVTFDEVFEAVPDDLKIELAFLLGQIKSDR